MLQLVTTLMTKVSNKPYILLQCDWVTLFSTWMQCTRNGTYSQSS